MKPMDETIQYDTTARLVALPNLRAMCARASGMTHRFRVETVSDRFVTVSYSNPDEYGAPAPILVSFFRVGDFVVLGFPVGRVSGGRNSFDRESAYDTFSPLLDCPTLWRSTRGSDDWATREEIEASKAKQPA